MSLVELVAALAIGLLIMLGLAQILANTRTGQTVDDGLARIQESGRLAMNLLARDIRMAGSLGCFGTLAPGKAVTNHVASDSAVFDMTRAGIEGTDFPGTGPGDTYHMPPLRSATPGSDVTATLPAALPSGNAAGSDVLVIRYMDSDAASLAPPYDDGARLFVRQPNSLSQDDILIVGDCSRASVFQATTVLNGQGTTVVSHAGTGTPGNICPVWGRETCPGRSYGAGARVAKLSTMTYYIGAGADGGPSLFRRSWAHGAPQDTELVPGIENLQLLYGIDTDHDTGRSANRYVTAAAIPVDAATGERDWGKVVSVRVAILVGAGTGNAGPDRAKVAANAETYSIAGVTLDPQDDRRLRRVFATTVALRNR